ncbi:MAG: hypothetical protein AAFW87_04615 [Pseudomonadota bacterium]
MAQPTPRANAGRLKIEYFAQEKPRAHPVTDLVIEGKALLSQGP